MPLSLSQVNLTDSSDDDTEIEENTALTKRRRMESFYYEKRDKFIGKINIF